MAGQDREGRLCDSRGKHAFVKIGLVEVVWPRDVHIIQASDLLGPSWVSAMFGSSCRAFPPIDEGSTDVSVPSEMLEKLDLAQGALGQDLLTEDIGNLLDGDTLLGLVVDGGAVREKRRRVSKVVQVWGKQHSAIRTRAAYQTMP